MIFLLIILSGGYYFNMEDTLVFADEGFLDKLTRFFGKGIRLKFDKFSFANFLSKKQGLFCKHVFYYTSPPFQGNFPTFEEKRRKEGYDKFISALSKNKNISIREGRCQKIINKDGKIEYHQKGVDTLLTIDLSHIKEDFPAVKKIILVSSDTDFCPAIRDIKQRGNIEVILYTYFDRKRNSKFSLSNELIGCCSKYFRLIEEDFRACPIKKEEKR
jgi:uncharacterized LabA/DUF88 family protein